jgi:Protein of unknown function (DUF3180)
VRPTGWRLLAALAGIAAVSVFSLVRLAIAVSGALPEIPWSGAVVVWVSAGALFIAALVLRPRLRRAEGATPMNPFAAARTAALAMAASRTGALLAGGYLGYALLALTDADTEYRRQMAVVGAVTALGGLAMLGAGLLLERFCRIPPEDPPRRADGRLPAAG